MSDLDFPAVIRFANVKGLVNQTYNFPCCTKLAATYWSNLSRTHALALIPGYAFMSGETWMQACIETHHIEPPLEFGSPDFLSIFMTCIAA